MPTILQTCQWVAATRLSSSIRGSTWIFPIIESVHTLGIVLVVGTVAIFDLRVLGLIMKGEPVSRVAKDVLPWTWMGFFVMLSSGLLLAIAEVATNYYNLAFRIKLVLLVLVGLNPLIFHTTIYRSVHNWELDKVTPLRARTAAACSLVLWSCIIIAGRLIAYLHPQ